MVLLCLSSGDFGEVLLVVLGEIAVVAEVSFEFRLRRADRRSPAPFGGSSDDPDSNLVFGHDLGQVLGMMHRHTIDRGSGLVGVGVYRSRDREPPVCESGVVGQRLAEIA